MLAKTGALGVMMLDRHRLLQALPTQKMLVALLMLIVAVVSLSILIKVLAYAFGMGWPID